MTYLCYIVTISSPHAVVVDSLQIKQYPQGFSQGSILQATFNYDSEIKADIILIPVHFPGHWGIVIHDSWFDGTYFFDSLATNPSRLNPYSTDKNIRARVDRIRTVISDIIPTLKTDNIDLVISDDAEYTLQEDGCSCGYFILLYAEAWIFNYGNLDLEPLNINSEKRKILWHCNELYSSYLVTYHSRYVNVISSYALCTSWN